MSANGQLQVQVLVANGQKVAQQGPDLRMSVASRDLDQLTQHRLVHVDQLDTGCRGTAGHDGEFTGRQIRVADGCLHRHLEDAGPSLGG